MAGQGLTEAVRLNPFWLGLGLALPQHSTALGCDFSRKRLRFFNQLELEWGFYKEPSLY